ncbi:hypothetical protein ACFWXK_34050 [Streptomyces sp. NPDC059070]|uniref:hypothetical protein n=1 Tax=unclassified Streptomyces TaxID=2593676 RepID=UPI0034E1A80F
MNTKLKHLALTAMTAALFAVGAPAVAHADVAPPTTIDPDRGTGRCHWASTEELQRRYSPAELAVMKENGTLPVGPVRICTGDGTGNGWGPVPPREQD